jgi:hypothetical protein
VSWSSDDGREDGTWCIITSETSLAHTGTVINNEGLNFFSHFEIINCNNKKKKKKSTLVGRFAEMENEYHQMKSFKAIIGIKIHPNLAEKIIDIIVKLRYI